MSLPRSLATFSFCLALFLSLVVYPSTASGVGFQTPSPDELKMTSEPQAPPGAPAIILYRQVDRDDQGLNGLTQHEDDYMRIKILTEEGRRYANVEIQFDRGTQQVVNIKARTIHADGSIVNFDGKIFEKLIEKANGVKYMAKIFALPDVQVGSIIEYFYTVDFGEDSYSSDLTGRYIYIYNSHWLLSHELFTRGAKFSLKPYQGSEIPVRWVWWNLPPGTDTPALGADKYVRLTVKNVPAFPTEDYMPPPSELMAHVDFIYSSETPEKDQTAFWKKIGKKLNAKVDSFAKSKGMDDAVGQIVSPNDPPEIKLGKIYAKVQQLRNISYEVQKTQQEEKHETTTANSVEEVWKRGYGTAGQLTWLFLALVRAAGFEAYGVYVSDRNEYFFQPSAMDDSKLNDYIVLIKLNGKDVYYDPGMKFIPFGLLPWPETAVKGLQLTKDGGNWIQTPLPESSQAVIERKANLKLTDSGTLEGNLSVTYSGLEAARRRVNGRNQDSEARKKFLEDEVKEFIPSGSEVELTSTPDWDHSAMTLVAEFKIKVPGWASATGRRAILPVGLFSSEQKHVFEHGNRVHPVYFEYPFSRLDDLTIEIPAGWKVENLPQPHDEEGKVVIYTLNTDNEKGPLHISRKLKVDLLIVQAKQYEVLQNFFQAVRTGDEEQIVLQSGTAVLNK